MSLGLLGRGSRKRRRALAAGAFAALLAVARTAEGDDSPRLALAGPRVNCTASPTTGGRVVIAGGFASQSAITSGRADADLLDPLHDEGRGRVLGPLPLAGRMFGGRATHAAVALVDGRVLLFGGDLPGSIEAFDPARGPSGGFVTLATLANGPHFGLTATLLADGRVLVAGGMRVDRKPSTATELFDPAKGRCEKGPPLATARVSHTATLLPDGRVLIAGGVGCATTEIFDPATGGLAPGPELTTVRDDHRATLLADGRVLLAGGQDGAARSLRSAEVIDVAAGRSKRVGDLGAARADHEQVLLADGRVLVIGGEDDDGTGKDRVLASVEVFDPALGTFSARPPLRTPRDDFAALLLADGRIAVIGGQRDDGVALADFEFLDP